eukprot:4514378-Pyramimonas_sp.AAC.1
MEVDGITKDILALEDLCYDIRRRVRDEALPPLTVLDIRQALKRMKVGGAMGVDRICVHDLDRLPDVALAEMCIILSVCEEVQCWPHQVLLIIGTLLPKRLAGDRIIGLLSYLARVWSQSRRGHPRKCSSGRGVPWMYRRGAGRATSDAPWEWVVRDWPVLRHDRVAEARSNSAEAGFPS